MKNKSPHFLLKIDHPVHRKQRQQIVSPKKVACSACIDVCEVFVFLDLELQEQEPLAKYKEMSLVQNIIMQQLGHINIEHRLYVQLPTRKAHTNHPGNKVLFIKFMS